MSFSFCLNKVNLVALAGFGISFQILDFNGESKLVQETLRSLRTASGLLEQSEYPGKDDFRKMVTAVTNLPNALRRARSEIHNFNSQNTASSTMPAPKTPPKHMRRYSQSQRQRGRAFPTSPYIKQEANDGRHEASPLVHSFGSNDLNPINAKRRDTFGTQQYYLNNRPYSFPVASNRQLPDQHGLPNLDYLDFSNEPPTFNEQAQSPGVGMNNGTGNPDRQPAMDQTAPVGDSFSYMGDMIEASKPFGWTSDLWTMSPDMNGVLQPTQSSVSLSEEELTSGEELSSCGASGHFPTHSFASEQSGLGVSGLDGFNGGFVL